jgi:hypothetical protein
MGKPFAQSVHIDLAEAPLAPPQPIHLGFRIEDRAATRCAVKHFPAAVKLRLYASLS